MTIKDQECNIKTTMQDAIKTEQSRDELLQKIAVLEEDNKRLETWLDLISKGYTSAINQLSINARMP